jgi:DNA polymerase-3 subunit delta'
MGMEMPDYDSLVGQELPARILRRAVRRGQVAHALLIHGERGLGMELAAWVLARVLLCRAGGEDPCEACPACAKTREMDHPDLEFVLPMPSLSAGAAAAGEGGDSGGGAAEAVDAVVRETADRQVEALRDWRERPFLPPRVDKARQIQVAQVRLLKKWAGMRSFEGGRRVAIIIEAERLGVQAQNALLKLLEEPPDDLVIILCSRQPEALLPTILSRCQSLALRPVPSEQLASWVSAQGLDRQAGMAARELAQLAGGNPGQALQLAEEAAGRAADPVWRPEGFIRDLLARDSDALYHRIMAMDESRDRERIKALVEDLQIWLLDAELVRLLGKEAGDRVVQARQLENLELFSARWRFPRLDQVLETLAEAARRLDRNVNIFVLLVTLAQSMRRAAEPIPRKQPA